MVMHHTLKNIINIFLAVLPIKLFCVDDKFHKPVVLYKEKQVIVAYCVINCLMWRIIK